MNKFSSNDTHARNRQLRTNDLWDVTHQALCAGHWREARACLDDLMVRQDVRDTLLSADRYAALSDTDTRHIGWQSFRSVLQDRIDLVNSNVERNARRSA